MNNPNIKLVLSDIDGTILNDQHEIDSKLPQVISQLNEKNIPFILASARSPYGIFPLRTKLSLEDFPIACYNGALVLEGSITNYRTITEHVIQNQEVTFILEAIMREFPQVSISLYSGINWIVNRVDKWIRIEADITKDTPKVKDISKFITENNPSIHKLLLIEKPEIIQQVNELLKQLNLNDSAFYLSKENYLEITSKEVSKEKALLDLSEYYNVSLLNTMTIGDNYNDIPMLTMAGLGIAMSNAPKEVKVYADVETGNNNNHGVSDVINKYILDI